MNIRLEIHHVYTFSLEHRFCGASRDLALNLSISVPDAIETDNSSDSGFDSLFDGEDLMSPTSKANQPVGSRLAPQIPGLFFDPSIEIPANLADDLWSQCMQMFFRDQNVNQIMLFERARSTMELDITANDDKRRSVDCDCFSNTLLSFLTPVDCAELTGHIHQRTCKDRVVSGRIILHKRSPYHHSLLDVLQRFLCPFHSAEVGGEICQ